MFPTSIKSGRSSEASSRNPAMEAHGSSTCGQPAAECTSDHLRGPEILAGLIVFPFEQARQVLTRYREFVESAPEELNVWAILRKAPPLPFLPGDVHGKEVVVLVTFYVGDVAQGRCHGIPSSGRKVCAQRARAMG